MNEEAKLYWRKRIAEAAATKDDKLFMEWLRTILPKPGSGGEVYIPGNGSMTCYTHYDPEVEDAFKP